MFVYSCCMFVSKNINGRLIFIAQICTAFTFRKSVQTTYVSNIGGLPSGWKMLYDRINNCLKIRICQIPNSAFSFRTAHLRLMCHLRPKLYDICFCARKKKNKQIISNWSHVWRILFVSISIFCCYGGKFYAFPFVLSCLWPFFYVIWCATNNNRVT